MPSNWETVEFLNAKYCLNGQDSFEAYLNNWQGATPPNLHGVINQVRALFSEK